MAHDGGIGRPGPFEDPEQQAAALGEVLEVEDQSRQLDESNWGGLTT